MANAQPSGSANALKPDPLPESDPLSLAIHNSQDADKRWPGWPGDCVFRLIVPVVKVGSIIGKKGELIKKMCEDSRARIRVLDGALGTTDRIVLIYAQEEPEASFSPAMDAVIRVFKRVCGLSENAGDAELSGTAGVAFISIRMLVASTQAITLIGKQGSVIKSIQENTAASIRVLSAEEVPFYAAADERIIEMQGETFKVLRALEAVVSHLRKFLVDHTVLPLFDKTYTVPVSQERQPNLWVDKSLLHNASQTGGGTSYPLTGMRESLYLIREKQLESQFPSSGLPIYGQEAGLSFLGSSGLGRTGAPVFTQITQTMQIPLSYAEDIIGVEGKCIEYIRRKSGALLTVEESRGLPDEITVEIKGTSAQVHAAEQLIQDVIAISNTDQMRSSYGRLNTELRSLYSQLDSTSYPSSSVSSLPYDVYGNSLPSQQPYGSSGLGVGYNTFRL